MEVVSKSLHTVSTEVEDPSMHHIRGVLRQYLQQSPAHFELAIEAHELRSASLDTAHTKEKRSTKVVNILVEGIGAEGRIGMPLTCHVTLLKRSSKAESVLCTIFTHNRRTQALQDFLSSTYPIIEAPLRHDTLWRWWQGNGKKFDWAGLPTELKEHIIEYCVHQPHTYGVYYERLTRFNQRYKNDRKIRKPGPLEIIEQLGDWFQLLYVSHQVRAITLRFCIIGRSELAHTKGLFVTATSMNDLSARLDRLGDFYQMVEPNGVPTSVREIAQSKLYSRFPRIYPELRQYATLRHGIQKISLGMDFNSSMHFFKVQAEDFQQYQKSRVPTYEVFERMPILNEIVIRLPLQPRGGWRDNPHAGGPALFHHETPCPRILHRLIYDRAAEVLAPYEKVTLRNFIDGGEKQRFLSKRLKAVKIFRFTQDELEELYADDSGGVQLGEAEREVKLLFKAKCEDADIGCIRSRFFPPSCHCNEPCALSPALWA